MPRPMTRREFLRGSALVSGAAVLVDPRLMLARGPARQPARGRRRAGTAGGLFTLVEYGDAGDDFLVRGTRLGGDYTLSLTAAAVMFQAPALANYPEVISLADFELGRGHDEIARYFGPEALDQLRVEVTRRRVFGGP